MRHKHAKNDRGREGAEKKAPRLRGAGGGGEGGGERSAHPLTPNTSYTAIQDHLAQWHGRFPRDEPVLTDCELSRYTRCRPSKHTCDDTSRCKRSKNEVQAHTQPLAAAPPHRFFATSNAEPPPRISPSPLLADPPPATHAKCAGSVASSGNRAISVSPP